MPKISQYPTISVLTGSELVLMDSGVPANRQTVTATSGTIVSAAVSSAVSAAQAVIVPGSGNIGYLNIPQNHQAANYGILLADSGRHLYHALGDGAATYTFPANASVAFPIGTAITFANMSVTSLLIAITSDTLFLAGAGTTGTRTLAQFGMATALKLTATTWLITGTNLT